MQRYWDRSCSAEVTLANIAPHFERYGITRIARQTSLDRLGIPVFSAFRPNATTLATAQGKGLTDAAAKVSAAMEAIEYALAEEPECEILRARQTDLEALGIATFVTCGPLPDGVEFPQDREISWVRGTNALDGKEVHVPLDLVWFSGRASDMPGICQHTNGLASGNCEDEAVFHGLCELVERDAGTLWALRADRDRVQRMIAVSDIADEVVSRLAGLVEAAGLTLRLFDQTTDIAVPTIMAEILPAQSGSTRSGEFSSGSGTHPVVARAAIRAITEAAQSRITVLAAARDDLAPQLYDLAPEAEFRFSAHQQTGRRMMGLELGASLAELLAFVKVRLFEAGIRMVPIARLGGAAAKIAVVKVLCAELEDFGVNLNWRPGPRARRFLEAAAR